MFFFFQAEDGIRDLVRSRGLGDVYKRQHLEGAAVELALGHLARQLRQRVLRALHVQAHRLLGPLHVLSLIHI